MIMLVACSMRTMPLEAVLFLALRSSSVHGTICLAVPDLSGLVTGPGGRCIYRISATTSSEVVVGRNAEC